MINQHFKLKHIYPSFWSCSVSTQHSQNSGNPYSLLSFHLSLVFWNALKHKNIFSGKGKNNCRNDGFTDRVSSVTVKFLWWDTVMSSKCLQLQYCLSNTPFNEMNSWLQATNVLWEIKSKWIYWCFYYWSSWDSCFFILNKSFLEIVIISKTCL